MTEEKRGIAQDGYQPSKRDQQHRNSVNSGYKPLKQTDQPAPPPKKP
ncbi:hypothetical protein [Kosakonia sp. H7A]|nr:hypothetical protein [Kosakonia sp. H7A]